MLQNAYFLAKIGADTAENEQHFAEILPKIGNYPTGRLGLAAWDWPRRVVHEARGRPDATVANELAGGHHLARGSRAPHSDRPSKARSPKRRANFADFGNTQAQRRQY